MFSEEYEQAAARVRNLWFQVILAYLKEDPEPLQPYFSDPLYQRLTASLQRLRQAGQVYAPVRPSVLSCVCRPAGTDGRQEFLICELQTRAAPMYTGKGDALSAAAKPEIFARERWTLARPLGAKEHPEGTPFGVHCAACGAPLSLYKSAKCPFCGRLIRVPDFSWTVTAISGAADTLLLG